MSKAQISFGASFLILLLGLVGIIAILPANLCVPFTDVCVFLTPLHILKKALTFFIALGMLYGYIAAIIFLFYRSMKWLVRNRLFKNVISFILFVDEDSWRRLRRTIS